MNKKILFSFDLGKKDYRLLVRRNEVYSSLAHGNRSIETKSKFNKQRRHKLALSNSKVIFLYLARFLEGHNTPVIGQISLVLSQLVTCTYIAFPPFVSTLTFIIAAKCV